MKNKIGSGSFVIKITMMITLWHLFQVEYYYFITPFITILYNFWVDKKMKYTKTINH